MAYNDSGRILQKCGLAERKFSGGTIHISEITPPAPGHQDFLAHLVGVIKHPNPAASLPGGQTAHQPCSTCANNNNIHANYLIHMFILEFIDQKKHA